jgi:hypothetical protein
MRVHLSARLKMDSYGNGEQIDTRYDARRARHPRAPGRRGPRLRWSLTPYVTIKYNAGPLSRFQDFNPFGDEGLSRRTPTPSSCRRRRRRQVRCRRRTEGRADEAQVARPRQHPSHRRWLRHLFAAALRLDGGALPALEELYLADTLASEAATAALMARFPEPDSENSDEE